MRVSWYERLQSDVRPHDDWLSVWERAHLHTLKVPKRRADWLLGRWTAKEAIADYLQLAFSPAGLSAIEIRPDATGAPEVFVGGAPAGVAISLSHRNGLGACAIAERAFNIGCDLELVEPRSSEFVADYFTPEEQAHLARASAVNRFETVALLWSAKESALKALRVGLRCSTRSVSVKSVSTAQLLPSTLTIDARSPSIPAFASWQDLLVRSSEGVLFGGRWCLVDGVVRTAVAMMARERHA